MSVRINYNGNIGNCLFQYVHARLLAERHELYLETPFPYQKLLRTTPHKAGKKYHSPKIILQEPAISEDMIPYGSAMTETEERCKFYEELNKNLAHGQYVLSGYFEYSELYNPYEELIRSYFRIPTLKKNKDDIVINIRFGDFARIGRIISSDWYLKILEKEKFDKLYIVGSAPNEPYLQAFEKFNPVIVSSDPLNDFHFIRSFDKIICSNSTYCWWAAFLSEATTIYISDKWISPLLVSCKSSVCIEADYIESYNPISYYSPVQKLISSRENLHLMLDSYIIPSNTQIKDFVTNCIQIIFNSVRSNPEIEPYVVQLDIDQICRFSMSFNKSSTWLSPGSALLADCRINFPDWKSFYDWINCGLWNIMNPYLEVTGYLDLFASWFKLEENKENLSAIYNDFIKNAPLLEYSEISDTIERIMPFLEKGAMIAWFTKEIDDLGKLYFLIEENYTEITSNKFSGKSFNKFYVKKEIYSGTHSDNDLNKISKELFTKGLRMKLFNITLKRNYRELISTKDALRIYSNVQADYLILGNFFIQ